jgi:glycerol kinase
MIRHRPPSHPVPPPRHILALDQGTSSSRALVFDQDGAVVAAAQQEFSPLYPKPGWVEHDPAAIWESQRATAAAALAQARLTGADLAAVGLTNQRETTLVWERASGRPVHPAIVWQDRRTADACERLRQAGAERLVTERTGLRLDPYFSATKLAWILAQDPELRRRGEHGELCFGTVDTWLLWHLTGGRRHLTDATNASRTLLYNLHTGQWDDDLLALFGIPRALLPEIRSCSEVYGEVAPGLPGAGAPIAGIAGDQQAALFGQACFHPGMAKNTYGTGCFLLLPTGGSPVASGNHLLTTVAWRLGGRTEYALEGSVFVAGAAIQWLRDELLLVASAQELDALAASVPDTGGVYLVPAFTGLGAPHWDPYARGTLVGLTRGTSRAHLCRAVLEAIAFQSADLAACMEKDSGVRLRELRVDGGASRSGPLMQFQADLLGIPVVRPRHAETTALGAAYLAGLAVGFWASQEEIARKWAPGAVFEPAADRAGLAERRQAWNRAVARAKGWEQPG